MNSVAVPGLGWLCLLFAFVVAFALLAVFLIWGVVKAARALHPELTRRRKDAAGRDDPLPPVAGRVAGPAGASDTTAACPECGAPLPADSPHGLCARCLLRQAMLSPD